MEISFIGYSPNEKLKKYIKKYWTIKGEASKYFEEIAPSGCMRIVFNRTTGTRYITNINSKRLKEIHDKDDKFNEFHSLGQEMGNCVIIGPSLDYIISTTEGEIDSIGIEFTFLGARRFFNTQAHEFKNKISVPQETGDKEFIKLYGQMNEPNQNIKENLDNFFINRLTKIKYKNKLEQYTINALKDYDYKTNKVENLKEFTFLQPRQTRRYFAEFIGIAPREFILIQKLRMAVHIMRNSPEATIDEIAYTCGFCDTPYFDSVFTILWPHTQNGKKGDHKYK